MDWKTVGNYVLLVGMLVGMVTMFNQVNGRLDTLNGRIDAMQIENNRRFDTLQGEINQMRTESNRRFDRVDQRFDQIFEALRVFEGRITRLEEKAGIGTDAE